MTDAVGRTIKYLRLSVTDRCNYRCRYCMEPEAGERREPGTILPVEALAEIAEAAIHCGVKKIRLTGGEPLTRRGILELCERLRSADGLKELTMTTNGVLLRQFAAELKSAGLDRLNISLDSLREERYRSITRGGSLTDALEGWQAAEDAGFCRTKLNVVLMGGVNEDEIPDFVALTKNRAVSVRFIELMPLGVCARWQQERFLSAEAVLKAVPDLEYVGSGGVAELYRLPGASGTVGLIRPMSRGFCGSCDRIRITADGKLKPCLHSAREYDLNGLHGAELEQAIRRAVLEKPEAHRLTERRRSDTDRRMNEIGG